jgi:Receptor family ligand binding region.
MKHCFKILIFGLLCVLLCSTASFAKDGEAKKHLKVAMLLPLNYDKIGELNFTKFNIEEKRKSKYACFEYITFFEGARIALDQLEKEGYNVSLYVYDVNENNVEDVKKILSDREMKDMDLIVPLVFQKAFMQIAEFSDKYHIPLINPMSSNMNIINGHPYVFKIQPSFSAEAETVVRYIKNNFHKPNVILLYATKQKKEMELYTALFDKEKFTWCALDYNRFAKRVFEKLSNDKDNLYISIVDKGGDKNNEVYANMLLNSFSRKKNMPNINLIAQYSWLDYQSLDYTLLQRFGYHFTISYLNDYTNKNFVDFVKLYRSNFKQEPDKIYAALGYDIMMYFVPLLTQRPDNFMQNPNIDRSKSMINPYYFEKTADTIGFQNKRTVVYKLNDYKIISVGR